MADNDKQFRLSEDAATHYHDGEPVGTEPFTPTETEKTMLGDLLIPVHDESEDADSESTDADADENESEAEAEDDFTALSGVADAIAENLHEAGYESFADLRDASQDELADVDGLTDDKAGSIHEQLEGENGEE